jgi:FkbM family methyltransferase
LFVDDDLCLNEFDVGARGVIIDGGANIGASTALLAARNPNAIVVAIEPAADNLRLLRENTASYPNVIVIEGGVWSKTGRLRIANSEAAYWAYRCEETSADDPDSFAAYSIDDIFTIAGRDTCDLLKLDVEGAEVNVFENPGPWLDKTRMIIVELHSDRARDLLDGIYESGSWKRERHGEKDFLIRRA